MHKIESLILKISFSIQNEHFFVKKNAKIIDFRLAFHAFFLHWKRNPKLRRNQAFGSIFFSNARQDHQKGQSNTHWFTFEYANLFANDCGKHCRQKSLMKNFLNKQFWHTSILNSKPANTFWLVLKVCGLERLEFDIEFRFYGIIRRASLGQLVSAQSQFKCGQDNILVW